MKKIYVLSLMLLLSVSFSKAQTTLTTAVDFTVTDTDGNSHNLFSILASGKYVCLDFFFTTCGPCQATCPYFEETFTNFGCNTQDIYFMSIDMGDTDAECETYETTFLGGADFPAVSGTEGGGDAVVAAYGIGAFPTYILIAPSHAIVEQDMWPISSAADFDTFIMSNGGLTHKACLSGIEESELTANLSVYPNPATDRLVIETSNGEVITRLNVVDVLGKTVSSEMLNSVGRHELNTSSLSPGMYFVEVMNANGMKGLKKFSKQ